MAESWTCIFLKEGPEKSVYNVNICEGYWRGRHLNATVPFSTPRSAKASDEHL